MGRGDLKSNVQRSEPGVRRLIGQCLRSKLAEIRQLLLKPDSNVATILNPIRHVAQDVDKDKILLGEKKLCKKTRVEAAEVVVFGPLGRQTSSPSMFMKGIPGSTMIRAMFGKLANGPIRAG